MKNHLKILGLLTVLVFVNVPAGFAQDDESALPSQAGTEETAPENTNVPAGQEVEINEDNYRQFMELKDARRQRGVLPEDAFKPKSGLKKLDDLPEESQKHLRNQLREIIVQGDQWQPGDEGTSYPYVPSEAALTDQALQKQEAEAWGELVDSYHKREAQIYENSARSQAAMASENNSGGGSSNGNGSPGDGTGQAGTGGQTSQQSRNKAPGIPDGYSPGGSNDPNAKSTAGVSQNAMEFLNKMGNGGANTGEVGNGSSEAEGSPGEAQAQAGQKNSAEQGQTADNGSASTSNEASTESMAGTSQNALEFLKGSGNQLAETGEGSAESSEASSGQEDAQGQGDAQDGMQSGDEQERSVSRPPASTPPEISPRDPDADSTAGDAQNALKYLTGEDRQPDSGQSTSPNPAEMEGTLTIEDLMNAQGVDGVSGNLPPIDNTNDEQEPDGNTLDKDGDG